MWLRHRFVCEEGDPRPVEFPPPGPFWCSGYSAEGGAVVITFLPPGVEVDYYWPDAVNDDYDERESITYTDRFPRPNWWNGE